MIPQGRRAATIMTMKYFYLISNNSSVEHITDLELVISCCK